MIRILSADLLIADVIVSLQDHSTLSALVQQYGLVAGGKKTLDKAQMEAFSAAMAGHATTVTPGGSSANMLTTLAKLLPSVSIRFLGIAGEGQHGRIIRHSLADAGIALLPDKLSAPAQEAVSFVMVSAEGQCTIATYPGNARALLKPEVISETLLQESDIVLLQGSLWYKFAPEFVDRLLALSETFGKELWLTLPTQAQLGKEEAAHFRQLLPKATLILGNEAELARLYDAPLAAALPQLQRALASGAAGFITQGKDGGAIVTAKNIEHVEPEHIAAGDIINTLGAGDTAYAGFAAGHIKRLPPALSAQIAMALAGEKLRINSPRLPDPLASLAHASASLAKKLR